MMRGKKKILKRKKGEERHVDDACDGVSDPRSPPAVLNELSILSVCTSPLSGAAAWCPAVWSALGCASAMPEQHGRRNVEDS
ncbi:hypothetical protein NDU88_004628 [Pleurodeles waltl]|uniref:Uncharacterized protein n=1 Tax=Pleurodeles waltl TaxID=8319 RepID=A0AAV7LKC6_PLEWA|nr:hypothetical protein NDU88_004628 [Pleurodeles waltl]